MLTPGKVLHGDFQGCVWKFQWLLSIYSIHSLKARETRIIAVFLSDCRPKLPLGPKPPVVTFPLWTYFINTTLKTSIRKLKCQRIYNTKEIYFWISLFVLLKQCLLIHFHLFLSSMFNLITRKTVCITRLCKPRICYICMLLCEVYTETYHLNTLWLPPVEKLWCLSG